MNAKRQRQGGEDVLLLPVWPCQKPVDKTRQKANACTKNNFDIWSTTESSMADSRDQNIKTVRQTVRKKEQRPKERQWHSAKMP